GCRPRTCDRMVIEAVEGKSHTDPPKKAGKLVRSAETRWTRYKVFGPKNNRLRLLGAFARTQFLADYTISIPGFDLRQGHGPIWRSPQMVTASTFRLMSTEERFVSQTLKFLWARLRFGFTWRQLLRPRKKSTTK